MVRILVLSLMAFAMAAAQAESPDALSARINNAHELIVAGKVDQASADLQVARKDHPSDFE